MLLVLLIGSGTLMALASYGFYELVAQDQTMLATTAAVAILCAVIYAWYLVLTSPLDETL